jgi:RNA polymerase sigma factor (sigma-70 family)
MASGQLNGVLQQLRGTLLPGCVELTDGQLLERFINHRDDAAFAALLRRHGPMVWGVCRRTLHRHHDAEDAFQATFLVLARRAASVVPREAVGKWLHGVAYQTARKARAAAARRQARESPVTALDGVAAKGPHVLETLPSALDRELSLLPEKYRVAIVLCDLEGRTRKEVARHLGVPEGTLSGWLTRGRALLARRLARHGLAVSLASLAIALAPSTSLSDVPRSLVAATVNAVSRLAVGGAAPGVISAKVAALTNGVLRAMLLQKIKVVTVLLLAVVFVTGGLFTYHTALGSSESARQDKKTDAPGANRADDKAEPAKKESGPAEEPRPLTIEEVTGKMLRTVGKTFDVEVVGRKDGVLSGTDLYFFDSSLEKAAVHAGLVKVGEKAVITVTVEKCPEQGDGSTRNGVTSLRWDAARADYTAFRLQRRAEKKDGKPGPADRPAGKDKNDK